tara:strand:+ start:1474 stop:1731 length:258 start_codon:yes stop_codon:yes gene_type:complete
MKPILKDIILAGKTLKTLGIFEILNVYRLLGFLKLIFKSSSPFLTLKMKIIFINFLKYGKKSMFMGFILKIKNINDTIYIDKVLI